MSIQPTDAQRVSNVYSDAMSRMRPATTSAVDATQTAAAGVNATGPQDGAVITLSPTAQLFARALAAAQSTPDMRTDRLTAVQAKLANGDDAFSADDLATKLLNGARA